MSIFLEIVAWGLWLAAMALSALIPLRRVFKMEQVITLSHVQLLCKLVLIFGVGVACAYGIEIFAAMAGGNPYEREAFLNRATGHYAWAYWMALVCHAVMPQFFWFKKICQNAAIVFTLSLVVNLPTWFEWSVRVF